MLAVLKQPQLQQRSTDNYRDANSLSSLKNFGDKGGELIVGIVDKRNWFNYIMEPKVKNKQTEHEVELKIGDLASKSDNVRINPPMEFGALYYIPNAYNREGRTGKVIQKLCSVLDDHKLDSIKVYDSSAATSRVRTKLLLDGSLDADFIRFIGNGVNVKAGTKYLLEFEIRKVRKRTLAKLNADKMMETIVNGPRCKNKFIPQVKGREKFQLIAAYYGELYRSHIIFKFKKVM